MEMVDAKNRDYVALRGKFTLCDSTYSTWERIERQAGQPKERKMFCLRCLFCGSLKAFLGSHHRRKNTRGDVFLRRHKPQFRVSFAGIDHKGRRNRPPLPNIRRERTFNEPDDLRVLAGFLGTNCHESSNANRIEHLPPIVLG